MSRSVFWLLAFLGLSEVAILFFILKPNDLSHGLIDRFEEAGFCEEKPVTKPLDTNGIISLLDQPVHLHEKCWQPFRLPAMRPAEDIKIDFAYTRLRRVWYRVQFRLPDSWPKTKPLMIFVPRINAYAWEIRANGEPVADNRFDWRSTWNRPLSVSFSPEFRAPNKLLIIDVGMVVSDVEGFSIARISVGDPSLLYSQKAYREYFQVILPQAVSAILFLLALFFFSFWLGRRTDTEFILLALASLGTMILNVRYTLLLTDNFISGRWYSALIYDAPIPWINCLHYLFVARIGQFKYIWFEKILWLQVIVITLLTLSPVSEYYDLSLLKGSISFLVAIWSKLIIIWQAVVTRNLSLCVIAVAIPFAIFTGFYDIGLSLSLTNPEGIYLSPYSTIIVYATYLFAIQRRHVAAINSVETLNLNLKQQLVEKDDLTQKLRENAARLRTHQKRLLEFEREQTLLKERQRLMRDMHDGLGSSLLSALSALENKDLPPRAIAETLRMCIEDLRLVIDSLEPIEHDLSTLLGMVRYRLGKRLDAAGFSLDWDINELPPLPWLQPDDALNILRFFQEALVNVLKHANASRVHVATRDLGDKVEIRIQDDGCGFNSESVVSGRGLRNLRKRAEFLGGNLQLETTPGVGTSIRLTLPINKPLTH